MADLIAELLGGITGVLPERQPWRSLVAGVITLGAIVGVTVLALLVIEAV